MTVQYTTQHSDLYGSTEALQLKIKCLGIAVQGEELIADLERHIIGIKHTICDLDRKIGGTLL